MDSDAGAPRAVEVWTAVRQLGDDPGYLESLAVGPVVDAGGSAYVMAPETGGFALLRYDRDGNLVWASPRPDPDGEGRDLARPYRLALDSSGDPLNQRGYRLASGEAPINEVLAAGIIALSGWDASVPLVDPMCGSGTFAIEAAMRARNIAPGLIRRRFGFMRWISTRGVWPMALSRVKPISASA